MSVKPGHCGLVRWEVPGAPANGWDEVTFPFTVHTAPDEAGYYFAQMFGFVGGNRGYCGVRPRPGARQLAAFSVFGQGATVVDADRCYVGADGGAGVSCSAWAPLIRHREYLFTVYREAPGSRVWRGVMTDATTREEWQLGAWSLSHDGGVKSSELGFLEHYKAIGSCDQLKMASLHFGAPYTAPAGVLGRCHGPYEGGNCKDRANYSAEAKPDGRVWMRTGWPTRRHQAEPGDRDPIAINVTVNVN